MLYIFNAFLLINIHLWWNGQMLGSLTCHYITQQISMKNFLPRSLHLSKRYIQYREVQITFNLYLGIGYLLSLSFSDVPTPFLHPLLTSFLDVLVHLAAGWHLYVCLGAFGSSLSVARSQIPDDTCEPWQSSWFTVVVSRLLCQTKHQYNVFSLTIPQQFPTQMTPAHFLLHSTWPKLSVQSYATVNTASESAFFSPCQRVLIIGECQGCLLGPSHFSQSQTHFLCCVTLSPIVWAHS